VGGSTRLSELVALGGTELAGGDRERARGILGPVCSRHSACGGAGGVAAVRNPRARAAPEEEVLAVVAEEVGRLLAVDLRNIESIEPDDTMTVVAGWIERAVMLRALTRWRSPRLGTAGTRERCAW
jgi:hypothetical protein